MSILLQEIQRVKKFRNSYFEKTSKTLKVFISATKNIKLNYYESANMKMFKNNEKQE